MQDNKKHEFYLTCERYYIFELLTLAAGMMGLYTLNLRGGVFCNAQTGNIALMSMELGKGNISNALYYLIPFSAYVAGTVVSEIMPNKIKRLLFIRWDTFLIGFEILALIIVGFIPLGWPDQIVQVITNFVCSMQYNTFRQAEGLTIATTFLTNHVRQMGIYLVNFIREKNLEARKKFIKHLQIIIIFFIGGVISTFAGGVFHERGIWLAVLPLLICFIFMLYADLVTERTKLNMKPHGH